MKRTLARVVKVVLVLVIAAGASARLLQAQLPQSVGTWLSRGAVADARIGAASVALDDGRTLVAGGRLADGSITDGVAVYDPVANATTVAGHLFAPRVNASATLLADGRVLITGGLVGGAPSADVEIFDLAAGTSAFAATMAGPRAWHASARLFDDTVLIVGGATTNGAALSSAEIFDPETSSIYPAGEMTTPRVGASATATIDHRVLIAGGFNGMQDLATAEIYDAFTSAFTPVPTAMAVARSGHTAVLLPHNAGVLLAGGTGAGTAVMATDLFVPAVFPDPYSWGMGSFAPTGALTAPRAFAVGGPLGDNGFAYVAGGGSADAEAYRFATIKTDKDDYAPGEPAIITGSGWQPGEAVTLTFQEDPAVHDDYSFPVTADALGNIYWDQWAPEGHDLGVRFYLTAQGAMSRAQATFTDAKGTATAITSSMNPSLVNQTVAFTATVTETSTGGGSAGQLVTVGNVVFREGGGNCNQGTALSSALALNAAGQVTFNFAFTTAGARTIRGCYAGTGGGTGTGDSAATVSQQVNADTTSPVVASIVRAGGNPSNAATVSWTVTFSENVTGVDATDFALAQTGLTGSPAITGVTGGPTVYTVSADTGNGTGTLGLNLVDNDSIIDAASNPLGSAGAGNGSVAGQVYAINRTLMPTVTAASKAYDGSTTATILTRGFSPAVSADVSVTGGTATFADANAGLGKTVTATGLGLSGVDAVRFVLSSTSATTTADITKLNASVSVSGFSGVYDAAAHGASGTVTGLGGVDLSAGLSLGATFTNVPGGTAHWTFSGGTNYNDQSGDVAITITPATATIVVNGYSGPYDAAPHGASLGSAVGVGGANLGASVTIGNEIFTNVPGGTVNWSFAEPNYISQNGTANIVISQAVANVSVTGYTGTYDGAAHGATGTATGVGGVDLSAGLNVGTSFTNAPGGAASWTFEGGTNYTDQSGIAAIVINKAAATVVVNGYTGTYDALPHGATGTAVGVNAADLSANLDFGATFTDAPGGTANWTFTGGTNYEDQNGTAAIVINKAAATVVVNGYTGTYDALPHGATGTAVGVNAADLSANLDFGASFTDAPGGTANWTFTGGTNYTDQNGTAAIVINKAAATVVVNGYTGTYDALPHGASLVSATGVAGDNLASSVTLGGETFTNVPGGIATWTFTGGTNYTNQNGTAAIVINKAAAAINVAGYTGVYDAAAHGASLVSATGVPGDNLTGFVTIGSQTFTNVPGGAVTWSFAHPNYVSQAGSAAISITPAAATINVSGYTGAYDGAAHGASLVSAIGVGGANLAGSVILGGETFTNVPGGTATWAFLNVNYFSQSGTANIVITPWKLDGFLQPVGVANTVAGAPAPTSTTIWNTIKGGQAVPLKFRLFTKVGGSELTSVSNVQGFALVGMPCEGGAEDPVDVFPTTGSTELRYSDGQFIQNWASPKGAAKCYRVTMTAADGSQLSAFFKTK